VVICYGSGKKLIQWLIKIYSEFGDGEMIGPRNQVLALKEYG
jgi:hypothetical protein